MTESLLISISIAAVVILIAIFISQYNGLAKNRNQIENAISSLDAIFIKRAELIPNLVEVVKRYMTFEEDTLEKITAMRTSNHKLNEHTENVGKQAVKSIMLQLENYPDLKADSQFTNLQYSWNEVEEQISAGRRYISASVTNYNNSIDTFPGNIIARFFGFKAYEWQYASEEKKKEINAKSLFN